MSPVTGKPMAGSPSSVAARIDTATTISATGRPGSRRPPPVSAAIATTPTASTRAFAWPIWPANTTARSKKLWPPPDRPNRLGSWVMAIVSPAPTLKPTRMLSLISFTRALSRSTQETRQSAATVNAARLAIWA